MRAVLVFLVAAAAALLVAYGFASIPGTLSGEIGQIRFDAPMSVAIPLLIAVFLIVYGVLRLLATLLGLPRRFGRGGELGRRREGDRAITSALMALAAGEVADARREASRARRLLGATPPALLVSAEADRLAGRGKEAEAGYEALAARRDSAFLGYRGLVRLAVERRDEERARILLDKAEKARPDTAWLRGERLALAIRTGDWKAALTLARDDAERAAFATAAADAEADHGRGLKLAKQAHKLAPALAAAALALARRYREEWSEPKAVAVLRETWRRAPNPLLAEAVLGREPDPLKRASLAESFVARAEDPVETALLRGRVALEAGMIGEARRLAEAARAASGVPDKRVLMLIADTAERDTALSEPERRALHAEALREAAAAPDGPHWRCASCAAEHAAWAPVCPSCFTPGRIDWTKVLAPTARPPRAADAPLLLGAPGS